jgi:hypothetical protein
VIDRPGRSENTNRQLPLPNRSEASLSCFARSVTAAADMLLLLIGQRITIPASLLLSAVFFFIRCLDLSTR